MWWLHLAGGWYILYHVNLSHQSFSQFFLTSLSHKPTSLSHRSFFLTSLSHYPHVSRVAVSWHHRCTQEHPAFLSSHLFIHVPCIIATHTRSSLGAVHQLLCTPYPVYLGSLLSAVGTYDSLSQQEPSRACCPRACLRGVHLPCGGSISQAVGISFTMFPCTILSHQFLSH